MTGLSGWGRYPHVDCRVRTVRAEADARAALAEGPLIARGNGRAYGDSAMNTGHTLDMRGMDRMLSFDAETGTLVAEAGVLLRDVIETFLPRGWFPMVTPGTKFVTLGGAIAADVHGKNHHLDGSFRACVDWIDIMGPDGAVRRAAAGSETFDWAFGGMGLTGVILRAQLRLRRVETSYIVQETLALTSLRETVAAFETHADAPYSVAWIDSSDGPHHGHSLLMLGRHATQADLPQRQPPFAVGRRRQIGVPFGVPTFLFRGLWLRAANGIYWRRGARRAGTALVDWDRYFYPLDGLAHWNRAYGRKGFVQFQCALPEAQALAGLTQIMGAISEARVGSVVSVLKKFGPGGMGISFPMAGLTLAMDFPVAPSTMALLDRLDAVTLAHGGRFYLAKDARMAPETAHADPRMATWAARRDALGLRAAFRSVQSERLNL